MNYSEIKTTTLAYIDRADDFALENSLDNFLKIVEARINTKLRIQNMSARATITTTTAEYYGLPADFAAFREVKKVQGSTKTALEYATPHSFDGLVPLSTEVHFFTIEANQLRIRPIGASVNLEIVYYKKVPALTASAITNWVSDNFPLLYVFGLLVECCAYTKDTEAAALWEQRFKDAMEELIAADSYDRWSGAPLLVRTE